MTRKTEFGKTESRFLANFEEANMTKRMNLRKSVGSVVLMVVMASFVACGRHEGGFANTKGRHPKQQQISRQPIKTTFGEIDSTSFKKVYPSDGEVFINAVTEVSDGYVLAGSAPSVEDSFRHPYIMKIDERGDQEWSQLVPVASDSEAYAICTTADGYMLVGRMYNDVNASDDVFAVRLLADGSPVMAFRYGDEGSDQAYAVSRERDGSYLIAGTKAQADILLLNINDAGEILSERTYGTAENYEGAYAMKQTRDGGILLGGFSTVPGNKSDALVVRLDSQLNVIASKAFANNDPERMDVITGIEEAFDGTYVACGASTVIVREPLDPRKKRINEDVGINTNDIRRVPPFRFSGNAFAFVLRLDSNLNAFAQVSYKYGRIDEMGMTPRPSWYLTPASIHRSSGGGYIMALNFSVSFGQLALITKLTADLLPAQTTMFDGDGEDVISDVRETTDFGIIGVGQSTSASIASENIQHDAMAVKISRSGEIRDDGTCPVRHEETQLDTFDASLLQIETAIQ